MRRRRRETEQRQVQSLLEQLGGEVEEPTEGDLRAAARLAAAEPRQPHQRPLPESGDQRAWWPLRLRWSLAAAAAILLATGLGFGFGAWLTPAGSAGSDVTGLGFLPAEGWTVVQSGSAGSAGAARAVAANVAVDPADRTSAVPLATLRTLPSAGVVIVATLTTRGDPAADAAFPLRTLPLRLVDAEIETPTQYRLRAGVSGYNLDAPIYFGSKPSPGMLDAAERQIERLVVSPDQLTIAVRPSIVGAFRPVTVYGSVASGKAGAKLIVQFRQCGLYPVLFRDVAELTTSEGGGFSAELGVAANGAFRAVAGDAASNQVSVQSRADIRLSPRPPGRYQAYVVDKLSYWRKRVVIQRFDRQRRRWAKVRTLRLERQFAAPGSAFVWSQTDEFAVKLPKGTTIRAVLPLDQARPCHIGGYSTLLRT